MTRSKPWYFHVFSHQSTHQPSLQMSATVPPPHVHVPAQNPPNGRGCDRSTLAGSSLRPSRKRPSEKTSCLRIENSLSCAVVSNSTCRRIRFAPPPRRWLESCGAPSVPFFRPLLRGGEGWPPGTAVPGGESPANAPTQDGQAKVRRGRDPACTDMSQ